MGGLKKEAAQGGEGRPVYSAISGGEKLAEFVEDV